MEFDASRPELPQPLTLEPTRSARRQVQRRGVVRVARTFATSPERVFDAWLDPASVGKWLFAVASRPLARVTLDARVGGAFRLVDRHDGKRVEHAGEYVEIERPRRLVFTLSTEGDSHAWARVTIVTIDIVSRNGGCELILAHENVPMEHAIPTENRWTGILYGLQMTLGTRRVGSARYLSG